METRRLPLELLAHAGRLLLEYNESTGEIQRVLKATAKSLTDDVCDVAVSYGSLMVSLGADAPRRMPVHELRFNMAVQARVHSILDKVRRGDLDPAAALAQLERVEAEAPRHSRWTVILMLGAAAASLAILLGADGARRQRRTGDGAGFGGPAGAWPASFQFADATIRRRIYRRRAGRRGDTPGLDDDSRSGADCARADPRAWSTFHQRTFRFVRQLPADEYCASCSCRQHRDRRRHRNHCWR